VSGIFGVLDSRHQLPVERVLADMGRAMTHREWYVVETCADEGTGMGLGRIGIGIFNRERQPLQSEDGNLLVFLSGELSNAPQLRSELMARGCHLRDDSHPELALRLYQDRGARFFQDLEGAFVLAIWHRHSQELIVVNDRAGLYPLFYAHANGRLLLAPEMKAIFCDPDFRKELDLTALAEYIRFQHLLGDKTFFQNLKLLSNASHLHYDLKTDTLTLRPYWDFSQIPTLPATLTFEEAADEAGRLLQAAVDRLTEGCYRLGVYLSAGLDSRVILGMLGRDKLPVTAITYGLPGSRDVVYAQQLARSLPGVEHHYFGFSDGRWVEKFADFHLALTEGFHSWIHAHGISILDQVRSLIEVNLTGLHGAEINWEDTALYQAPDDMAFTARLFQLLSQDTTWPSLTEAEESLLFAPQVARHMQGLAFDSLRAELARHRHLSYERRAAHFSCSTDRRLYQYYTVFHMSHVEQRFPFYDYRYFEFIHALPPQMLYQRKLRRAIIRRRMPALARIPYDKDNLPISAEGTPRLLMELVRRGKAYVNACGLRLFSEYAPLNADYEGWLRHELRDWGEQLLLGERTLERGLFNPGFLRSLWQRHQSGLEVNIIGKLAPLMTYEMMLRRFCDGSSDSSVRLGESAKR